MNTSKSYNLMERLMLTGFFIDLASTVNIILAICKKLNKKVKSLDSSATDEELNGLFILIYLTLKAESYKLWRLNFCINI